MADCCKEIHSQINTVVELSLMRQQLSWGCFTFRPCIVLLSTYLAMSFASILLCVSDKSHSIFFLPPKPHFHTKAIMPRLEIRKPNFFLLLSNLEELNKRIIWKKPFLSEWAFRDKMTQTLRREKNTHTHR